MSKTNFKMDVRWVYQENGDYAVVAGNMQDVIAFVFLFVDEEHPKKVNWMGFIGSDTEGRMCCENLPKLESAQEAVEVELGLH